MKTLITEALVRKLPLVDQDIWDTRCRGLVLRGRASGRHSYRFQVRRGRWITIGATDDFKPDTARVEAQKLRGDIAHGKDPHAERRAEHAASLSLFLEKEYGPWVKANRQTGAETLRRLAATFEEFDPLPLKDITLARVERWRTGRLLAGIKPSTVNRDLASLRSVLSRAVEFGVLREHPLSKLKASRVDERGVVRYLTPGEEKQLADTAVVKMAQTSRSGTNDIDAIDSGHGVLQTTAAGTCSSMRSGATSSSARATCFTPSSSDCPMLYWRSSFSAS